MVLSLMDDALGGKIYIPKLPQKSLIEIASAFYPALPIKIIGRRPGEKLKELLWSENEVLVEHDNYYEV